MFAKHTPFKTKHFNIFHQNSSMKVGTDAILLGMWCDVSNAKLMLDVGTGCGIIAMIMASRSQAKVFGVDNHKASIDEAKLNFENSTMLNRLKAIEDDFVSFSATTEIKFDLVVSNPPFFKTGLKSPSLSRQSARHTNNMSHLKLCKGALRILNPNGKLCVVLPYDQRNDFISIADSVGFSLERELIISPKPESKPNRINMEFCISKVENLTEEHFTIRESDGSYSTQYRNLVNELLWV